MIHDETPAMRETRGENSNHSAAPEIFSSWLKDRMPEWVHRLLYHRQSRLALLVCALSVWDCLVTVARGHKEFARAGAWAKAN